MSFRIHYKQYLGKVMRLCSQMRMSSTKNVSYEALEHRCLMKLCGTDAQSYLQGMLTNDMNAFSDINATIAAKYAMVLNTSGRVLCDCLVYKIGGKENQFLLESDEAAIGLLKKHLDTFKLRKKVDIQLVQDMAVWVAHSRETLNGNGKTALPDASVLKNNDGLVFTVPDPRISELGLRFIINKNSSIEKFLQDRKCVNGDSYDVLRYKFGVGEGVKDHPPGQCLPFETNIDILNGVSFNKGCYIGQEVTAKIHFTGVVRKRLMPVTLSPEQECDLKIEPECLVINDKGKRVGRLRNNIGKYGLATLNVADAIKCNKLLLKGHDFEIIPSVPKWWPADIGKVNTYDT